MSPILTEMIADRPTTRRNEFEENPKRNNVLHKNIEILSLQSTVQIEPNKI
jgi:hypothetical protein